jgi:hypothetical protein
MAGQRSETGRKEFDSDGSLPGLGSGTMIDVRQISGILQQLSDRLNISVRKRMALGPMCFRCSPSPSMLWLT